MLILSSTVPVPTLKAPTLTVNCGTFLRGATHCASGSLYGITETLPSDISGLVAPLNPCMLIKPARAGLGYQQPIAAAIPVAGRLHEVESTARVLLRLADIYPNWPYSFTNMTDWLNKVTAVIHDKKTAGGSFTMSLTGMNNAYGYRILLIPCDSAPVYVSSGHTYKLVNMNSGKILGISGMSTADGANAIQWGDNGTADHNWTITLVNGYYRLKNVNSGKVLGISGMSKADGADAI